VVFERARISLSPFTYELTLRTQTQVRLVCCDCERSTNAFADALNCVFEILNRANEIDITKALMLCLTKVPSDKIETYFESDRQVSNFVKLLETRLLLLDTKTSVRENSKACYSIQRCEKYTNVRRRRSTQTPTLSNTGTHVDIEFDLQNRFRVSICFETSRLEASSRISL